MISVIIPFYNSERILNTSIESVLGQTYEELEIILVDDGSQDNTLNILLEYQKKDTRIIVLHKENEGVSLARNYALQYVSGDYILFVDADDWIEQNTCEIALKTIEHQNADVVMWPYVRETGKESLPKKIWDEKKVFVGETVQSKLHRRMIGILNEELRNPENADALCTVWGKLYKSSILKDNDICFFDIRKIGTYEDGLFNLSYFEHVNKCVYIPEYLYHYTRTDSGSLTNRYNPKLEQQWNGLFDLMSQYIKEHGDVPMYKEALANRISLSLIVLGINQIVSNTTAITKIGNIRKIICSDRYVASIHQLKQEFLPIHWKVFFGLARRKCSVGVYFLLIVIQMIRGR